MLYTTLRIRPSPPKKTVLGGGLITISEGGLFSPGAR